MDRQCSSGLMAIATAAKYIINDDAPVAIGAGIEFDLPGPERHR